MPVMTVEHRMSAPTVADLHRVLGEVLRQDKDAAQSEWSGLDDGRICFRAGTNRYDITPGDNNAS